MEQNNITIDIEEESAIDYSAIQEMNQEDMVKKKVNEFKRQMGEHNLHIPVHPECNNFCVFCFESDRDQRRYINSQYTPEVVHGILEEYRPRVDSVNFSSGEPTLNPNLIGYVAKAKELNYKRISLTTNGRRIAYKKYALDLAKAGITEIVFSLHGHNAKMHQSLTRDKGSFEQIIRGIKNIVTLADHFNIRVVLACVLNAKNLPAFREMVEFFHSLKPFELVFNVVQPRNTNMKKWFKRYMPTYSDVAKEITVLYKEKPEWFYMQTNDNHSHRRMISVIDLPFCIAPQLGDIIGLGETRIIEEDILNNVEKEKINHQEQASGRDEIDGEFGTTVFYDNESIKTKLDSCSKCMHNDHCSGIYTNYIEGHGDQEFIPITSHKLNNSI